jgi:tRNA-specific 2-thiouridylase
VDFESPIVPPAAIAVAMSGGVDSSLAAALLKERGYQVIGLTMRLYDLREDGHTRCCSPQAFNDARAICHQWGIPHYVLDFREHFGRKVIEPFVREYIRGRTPNPCVLCNAEVKWAILLHKARAVGAHALATGHYARIRWDAARKRFLLLRGVDAAKDQSYALWGLSQEALSRTVFPLGGLTKAETRRAARKRGLKVADKRDSQEICFVPDDDYGRFIKEWLARDEVAESTDWSPGPIVNRQGQVLGQHAGIPFYTIGQRRGLGLATGRPLYVLDIDCSANRLVVGPADDLFGKYIWAEHLNWVSSEAPTMPMRCSAQIRYAHRAAPVKLFPPLQGIVHGVFQRPQRAITPGQSVVFYNGEELLAGGIIRRPSAVEAELARMTMPSAEAKRKS